MYLYSFRSSLDGNYITRSYTPIDSEMGYFDVMIKVNNVAMFHFMFLLHRMQLKFLLSVLLPLECHLIYLQGNLFHLYVDSLFFKKKL